MEYNRYNIALLCTSAIYFFVWVAALLVILNLSNVNNNDINDDGINDEGKAIITDPMGPILLGIFAAFALLYPLSFFGSLFFVAINQKKSDKWFLGLPLPIVLLTLILSLLCPYLHLYIPEELFFFIPVLAAPASALFIKSVPEERRESAKKYVKVAKVISIYAAIIGFMYFIDSFLLKNIFSPIDHSSSSVYIIIMLLMLIYMAVGLPSIGICLMLMAKEKQPRASTSKRVHKPSF
ncbi:MAG: hypothetical protein EHM20_00550 [Alphaproteobacteria bacterium]|nr:MAG: hypothetical protein EHM20_00550 [Alphaproteobacteria bacterium]